MGLKVISAWDLVLSTGIKGYFFLGYCLGTGIKGYFCL
jgi:hypothetical protein